MDGRLPGGVRTGTPLGGNATPGPKALTVPVTILITASVAVRRQHPLAVGSFVSAAFTTLLLGVDGPDEPGHRHRDLLRLVRPRRVDRHARVRRRLRRRGRDERAGAARAGRQPEQRGQFTVVPLVAMLIARRAVRDRQLRAEALAARAELLEREQELRANEAVAEERARIARELHDLVAHNVSVMVVQAGAERHALARTRSPRAPRSPRSSRRAAGAGRGAPPARDAAPQGRSRGARAAAERRPARPLVEQVSGRGCRSGSRRGRARPAPGRARPVRLPHRPGGADQRPEARRPARARGRLRYAPRALDVEVRDDGAAPPGTATGRATA